MDTFDPINTALLLVITVVLGWYLRDRFAAVDKRLDTLEKDVAEMKTLLASQQALVAAQHGLLTGLQGLLTAQQGRLDELSREIVAMRSDQVQIALAVGAKARPEPA